MTIKELRQKLREFRKYPGTEMYPASPVIHPGFPNCFNLSFAEYEFLEKFGQYLYCDQDFIYSKIQPCVRHHDWEAIKSDKENRYRYLSLFEMSDGGGLILLKDKSKQEDVAKWSIKSFIDLIKFLGLDVSKLRVSFFQETTISEATDGKYKINKTIPTDPMVGYWKELGIKDEQFIPDKTRDTFLSLRIFGLPTPWGYRNELYYEHQGKLLDIGTVEHMRYEPIFNEDEEVCDIKDYQHSLSVCGVGIERLNIVINNLDNVWDIDTIKPLIDFVLLKAKNKDKIQAMIGVQAFRAINKIIIDGGIYSALNKKRKEVVKVFYYSFFESLEKLEITFEKEWMTELLNLNATLQEDPELFKNSSDLVFGEFLTRYEMFLTVFGKRK